jgi:hexosaminidase
MGETLGPAAAERQWSYDVVTTSADPSVAPRLQAFRCMLLERGIPAAPVTNAGARQAPAGPGSCLRPCGAPGRAG